MTALLFCQCIVTAIPKLLQLFRYIANITHFIALPFPRKQLPIFAAQKPFVQQLNDSNIRNGTNYPSRRLQHFVHSRIPICIIKSIAGSIIIKLL